MADFTVNKEGILINGVSRSVGDTIDELDVGRQVNALRASGKIRETTLTKNQGFTDGQRFNGIGRTFVSGESIGTGDDITTVFTLDNTPSIALTETIFVDGVEQERGTDYTIDHSIGEITFTSAPANGLAITGDYQHHIVIS